MNISKFIKGIIGVSALLISTCLWANNLTEQTATINQQKYALAETKNSNLPVHRTGSEIDKATMAGAGGNGDGFELAGAGGNGDGFELAPPQVGHS